MRLTNKAYNLLKFVALVLLPGANAAYFGLDQIWHLPNTEKVIGTIAVVDTLLGLLLKNSTSNFRKEVQGDGVTDGELVVQMDPDDGQPQLGLAVNRANLAAIPNKEIVTLRVVGNKTAPPNEGGAVGGS